MNEKNIVLFYSENVNGSGEQILERIEQIKRIFKENLTIEYNLNDKGLVYCITSNNFNTLCTTKALNSVLDYRRKILFLNNGTKNDEQLLSINSNMRIDTAYTYKYIPAFNLFIIYDKINCFWDKLLKKFFVDVIHNDVAHYSDENENDVSIINTDKMYMPFMYINTKHKRHY